MRHSTEARPKRHACPRSKGRSSLASFGSKARRKPKDVGEKYGIAPSAISMVLSGDRPPNDKIISALKLRRVVAFERVDE